MGRVRYERGGYRVGATYDRDSGKSLRERYLQEKRINYARRDAKLKQCIQEYEQYNDSIHVQQVLNNVFNNSVIDINMIIGQYLGTQPHQKFLGMIEELTRSRSWFYKLHRKELYDRITYNSSLHDELKKTMRNNNYLDKKDVAILIDNYSLESQKWTLPSSHDYFAMYRMGKLGVLKI